MQAINWQVTISICNLLCRTNANSDGKIRKIRKAAISQLHKGVLCLGWRWLGGDLVIFAKSERIEGLFCKSKAGEGKIQLCLTRYNMVICI
jgi:hypothetical protein